MNNLYYKKKKLGRVVSIQPFNGRMLIIYADNYNKLIETPNDKNLYYGKPRTRFYKVSRSLKSKIKYEISKRLGKNRSRRNKNR